MLKELRISNFRLFDDEVTLRFRPITVLIGRNNSGKSSIIKFLLMLQQSLSVGNPNLLQPEGDRVRFGSFENLKNSLTQKQQLEFELRVSNPDSLGGGLRGYLQPDETDIEEDRLLYATKAMIPYDTDGSNGGKRLEHETRVLLDSKEILVVDNLPNENYRLLKFPSYLDSPSYHESKLSAKVRENAPVTYLAEEETQKNIIEILQRNIRALKHLQATRVDLARIEASSSPPPGDVGQDGRYTLPHLQRLYMQSFGGDRPVYGFIQHRIRAVAGVREIIFERPEKTDEASAVNDKTGAKTPRIADFGFGVSQCLPIFVQGALMPPHAHLMIEQPEAQLHPTAQLELGSFFADLWKTRKVGSIIETHGDNILLRLQRLVAKGDLSTEDVSVAYFANDEEKDNMPIIKNLDINEDGSVEDGLPMEFFGKSLDEVLKMGMGK